MAEAIYQAQVATRSDWVMEPRGSILRVVKASDAFTWTAAEFTAVIDAEDNVLPRHSAMPVLQQAAWTEIFDRYYRLRDLDPLLLNDKENSKRDAAMRNITDRMEHGMNTLFTPKEQKGCGIAVFKAEESRMASMEILNQPGVGLPLWKNHVDYLTPLSAQSVTDWDDRTLFVPLANEDSGWDDARDAWEELDTLKTTDTVEMKADIQEVVDRGGKLMMRGG